MAKKAKNDIAIQDESSIVLFYARTKAGTAWIHEHIAHASRFGFAYVVEHRYAPYILQGMLNDGLTIGRATGGTWGMMQ